MSAFDPKRTSVKTPLTALGMRSIFARCVTRAAGAVLSANGTINFWFTVGSTYTYLTVSRLHEVEAATGIRFRWHPFNARAIMQEMNNIPFATKPIKLAYMWRDIERRAAYNLRRLRPPIGFPQLTLLAKLSRLVV